MAGAYTRVSVALTGADGAVTGRVDGGHRSLARVNVAVNERVNGVSDAVTGSVNAR